MATASADEQSEHELKVERIESLLQAWRALDLDGKRHQLVSCLRVHYGFHGARAQGACHDWAA